MDQSSQTSFFRSNIVRLIIINLVTLLVVSFAFLIVISTFGRISEIVDQDVRQNSEKTFVSFNFGKRLLAMELKIHNEEDGFNHDPEGSIVKRQKILGTFDGVIQEIKLTPNYFQQESELRRLVEYRLAIDARLLDNIKISQSIMQLELFNAKFLEILDEMEIETGKKIVEMVLAGLKPTGLQQITALIPFCREQILTASIVMERGVDDLAPDFLVGVPTKDGGVTLVGTMVQLSQTLQTLTSSSSSIASKARKIIAKIHEYEKIVSELANSLQDKKKHHREVERLGQSVSLSVSKLDEQMATNLEQAAERTTTVMASSTRAMYLIALVVLLVSCLGTTLAVLLGRKMNHSIAEKERAGTDLSEKMVLLEKEVERRQNAEREARQLAENLEKSVQERTVELHSLNMELQSIVYSMSHDLRTPLRGIAGFSNAILADCGANLDISGKHYLARIQDATITMGRTIDQILELSRFSRETIVKEKLELSGMVEAIILEFQRNDPDRSVQVEITPNLYAFGAKNQIRAVLESLLANAWKFTGRKEQAKIKFGSCRIDDKPVFYVKDNGVGFNQEYSAKMFGAFQRLHLSDDFPGAGIGLALVQRVVQRHAGKVWGEGKEGEGATFYFQI